VTLLQLPAHAGSSLADFSTLKMEAIRSFETSVQSTTSTRRHTPEDGILHFLFSFDSNYSSVNSACILSPSCPYFGTRSQKRYKGIVKFSLYIFLSLILVLVEIQRVLLSVRVHRLKHFPNIIIYMILRMEFHKQNK
jgi:hypothetical protein